MAIAAFHVGLCQAGGNLAGNASFEDPGDGSVPKGWSGGPAVYSRDAGVARTGAASLKYVNADPGRYRHGTSSPSTTAAPGGP